MCLDWQPGCVIKTLCWASLWQDGMITRICYRGHARLYPRQIRAQFLLAVSHVEFPPRFVPLWLSSSSALNKCCCRIPPNQFEFLSVPSPFLSSSSSAHTLQQNPRIFFCHWLNRSLDHILIGIKTFPTSSFLLSTDTGLDEEKTFLQLHLIPSLNQKQEWHSISIFLCFRLVLRAHRVLRTLCKHFF